MVMDGTGGYGLVRVAPVMVSDMLSFMAQSLKTNRSSFSSSNGYESPSLNSAAVSNGDDYDSDGTNFAPQ